MQRTIGVNTWVWTSPLTDSSLAELAPKIARMGFGAIELPLENAGDWDAARAGDLLRSLDLQPVVIGAMGPGRSLVDRAGNVPATQVYLRTCLAAARGERIPLHGSLLFLCVVQVSCGAGGAGAGVVRVTRMPRPRHPSLIRASRAR